VLHIHWPEFLTWGTSRRDAALSLFRVPRLLRKLRREKIGVVRTLHNLVPHESGHPLEKWFTLALDACVHKYIALNRVTDVAQLDAEVILHGDYVERFANHPRSAPVPGRVLYFGLIRPYKGIDTLISSFGEIANQELSLSIIGLPNSPAMRRLVEVATLEDPRIRSRLEFVADDVLVAEVSAAQLVVLPYREIHNSGSLLAALSLGRPVLTLDTAVNRSISDEVGPAWIWFYDGVLTGEVIEQTLRQLVALARDDDARPTFESRDWRSIGEKHSAVYRQAIAIARGH
jgi:beta-1,4-mannosyltransferase